MTTVNWSEYSSRIKALSGAPAWTSIWSGNVQLIPPDVEVTEGITGQGVYDFDVYGVYGLLDGPVRVVGYWTEYWSGDYYESYGNGEGGIPFDAVCDASNNVNLLVTVTAGNNNFFDDGGIFSLYVSGDSQLAGEWGLYRIMATASIILQ